MSDAEIIESSLEDGAAFALLFDRHYRSIHRFLRGRVGAELADDLAAETFTVAFRRRQDYDLSRTDARPWLYGIATHLQLGRRRTEVRRLRAYSRVAIAGEGVDPRPDAKLDAEVARALLTLEERGRTLLLLHAWADLSYEQLAEALELPLGTVRSRLSRIKAKLRADLEDTEPALAGGDPS